MRRIDRTFNPLRPARVMGWCLVAVCMIAMATHANAQSKDAGKLLRMVNPGDVAVGEEIEILVEAPPRRSGEDRPQLSLGWYAAGATSSLESHVDVSGMKRVKIRAPYRTPGNYQLRLFDCSRSCEEAAAVLPVKVTEGKVVGALKPLKRIYGPGEPINVEIALQPNRYYYGIRSGPTVQLLPPDPEKKLSKEQVLEWLKECPNSCQAGLLRVLLTEDNANPFDGGFWLDEEKLKKSGNTVTVDMAQGHKDGLIESPLFAPEKAGIYEIRLYDRGWAYEWDDYSPYYIDSQIIVVQGTVPESTPATLNLVHQVAGKFERFDAPGYFADFQIEATYTARNKGIAVEVPLALGGNGQLFEIDANGQERFVMNVGEDSSLPLMRISDTVYRSGLLRVKPRN